jgi:hypothetical protein
LPAPVPATVHVYGFSSASSFSMLTSKSNAPGAVIVNEIVSVAVPAAATGVAGIAVTLSALMFAPAVNTTRSGDPVSVSGALPEFAIVQV